MQRIPERTVERLSQYRRSLLNLVNQGKTHIYSHELAQLHSVTAVQVRRDLMFIGYSGAQRKGYEVKELVRYIGSVLDPRDGFNLCIVGMGNLGRAVTAYFSGKRPKLNLVATFDNDPAKADRMIAGIYCHPMKNLREVILSKNISIAIITVPMDHATEVAQELVLAGIKGILNLTTVPLVLPPHIHLEDYDMITSLEKVAYFVNQQK
ncbi:MAG: redox-sensing transcriptional repressor Rex [Bacteroidales bacterium]